MMAQLLRLVPLALLVLLMAAPGRFAPGSEAQALIAPLTAITVADASDKHPTPSNPAPPALMPVASATPLPAQTARPSLPLDRARLVRDTAYALAFARAPPPVVLRSTLIDFPARTACSNTPDSPYSWPLSPCS